MIYLDESFSFIAGRPHVDASSFLARPFPADLIAVRIYHSNPDIVINDLDYLSRRSKQVALAITEPAHEDFEKLDRTISQRYDNVTVFANVITNYESKIITNITWFNGVTNHYRDTTWGKSLLSKLADPLSKKSKKFDLLLGRSKKDRDMIANWYCQASRPEDFIFKYYQDNIRQGQWDFDVSMIESSANSVQFDGATPSASHVIPVEIYNNSYYSLVTETVIVADYNFFTEKIAKPLVAMRPFIVFAGRNYLCHLRQLGFETFGDIIDESYDQLPDWQNRYQQAWKQVQMLQELDPIEVMRICRERLHHNQQVFLNTDWNSSIKEYLAQF